MGLVNTVVPLADLEKETVVWCREITRNNPTALRLIKAALNAQEDGAAGIQVSQTSQIRYQFALREACAMIAFPLNRSLCAHSPPACVLCVCIRTL